MSVETILHNAKFATNGVPSFVQAVAVEGGKISAAGKDDEVLRLAKINRLTLRIGTQPLDSRFIPSN